MYAVIDAETTGLHVDRHDRVCELAIVHVDADGAITGEWCSLINPERDLGPQHIHGISAAECRGAPTFKQLAPEIARQMRQRVVTAHNLVFDARFVAAEYARMGLAVPMDSGLCTMELAARFLPLAGRSLASCCDAAGIEIERAHSALYDARATALLLGHYLRRSGRPPAWQTPALMPWPELAAGDGGTAVRAVQRGRAAKKEHFLARLVDRLPRVPDPPQADAYLGVLDRALLDHFLSIDEVESLVATAEAVGLSRESVRLLHGLYLDALAAEAADDGAVTAEELEELRAVAALLGLPVQRVDLALTTQPAADMAPGPVPRFTLAKGDVVVFTGQTRQPREYWEAQARGAGLEVGRWITRRTRLLVAADPDTMSGKARQARRYGIPIVHAPAFLRMLR